MKAILQEVSIAVWNKLGTEAQYGLREDGITPFVLAQVVSEAKKEGITVSVITGQGRGIEKQTGADWTWWIEGGQPTRYMVQAKKLDIVKAEASFSYIIDLAQLDTLITAAGESGNIPVYVFYNTGMDDENPADTGCTVLAAHTLAEFFQGYSSKQILTFAKAKEIGATTWAGLFG